MPGPNPNCRCATKQHHHGTHQCYRSCGCREQECKDANAAEKRAARRRKYYGTAKNHLVEAKPVKKHIKKLFKQGWGVRAVSRETGLSQGILDPCAAQTLCFSYGVSKHALVQLAFLTLIN